MGRKILTKSIDINDEKGDSDMWNVTSFYKNSEGTEAERLAVYNAVKGVPKAQHLYDFPSEVHEDVFFDLVDIDSISFGQNFEVKVEMENKSNETRTISAVLSASSIFYTGVTASGIKRFQKTFTLNPQQKETLKIDITPEEYLEKLVDHGLIKIYAIANVRETKQTWSEEDDFTLIKPEVTIGAKDECKVGEDCNVTFR